MIAQIKVSARNGQHQVSVRGLSLGRDNIEGILATAEAPDSVISDAIQGADSLIRQIEAIRAALCEAAQTGLKLETTIDVDIE